MTTRSRATVFSAPPASQAASRSVRVVAFDPTQLHELTLVARIPRGKSRTEAPHLAVRTRVSGGAGRRPQAAPPYTRGAGQRRGVPPSVPEPVSVLRAQSSWRLQSQLDRCL